VVVKPGAISFDAPSAVIAGGPHSITYVLGLISDFIPMVMKRIFVKTSMGRVIAAAPKSGTMGVEPER
jgi:hypothetical protein